MSQISLSITLYTGIVTSQPAGGWGSWSPPSAENAPYPLYSGTDIYAISSLEISKLRDYNLISDETLIWYKLRISNSTKNVTVTSAGNVLGLTGARVLRSLARLVQTGLIKKYSIADVNVSWIKISAPFAPAQIRSDWQNKVSDDISYIWQVLNYLRAGNTTSQIDLVSLYPSWSITNSMLGEAIAYYAGSAVNAFSVDCGAISVEFFAPVINATITDSEITTLYRLGLIGDNFYHYIQMRSQLAASTKSQIINCNSYCNDVNASTERYLKTLLRLRQSTLISGLDLGLVEIQWVVKPNTNKLYLNDNARTQLKEAGYFIHQLAATSSGATSQQVNLIDTLKSMKLGKKTKADSETGLNYLLRSVPDTLIVLDAQNFVVTWA
ncbi:MAG: hypothetical protein ABI417_11060 [Coleofasciculaceae cyanobacterium]